MNRGREVLVGAVILVGVIIVVAGSLWLSDAGFGRPTYPIDVVVSDVGQLREGNAAKFRGVQIGRVSTITVEPGGEGVRIRVLLSDELELPADAAALVAAESLFGEWQVELVSRASYPSFDFFELGSGTTSDDGVPLLAGFTYPDISRLTAAANQISENLEALTDRVESAFTDSTALALADAIENVQLISDRLRRLVDQQATTIESVTADVALAAREIGAAARAGRSTLDQVDSLLAGGELGRILVSIEEVSSNLAAFSGEMSGSSEDFAEVLSTARSTFERVDRLTERVENGEGVIGRLMTDSTLVAQTSGVLGELELLLRDLRENPSRYVRLSIF